MDCHCPIPVGLLFDSYEILSRSDSKFSRGNLASDNTLYQSAADFAQLPFPLIYHNRAIYQDEDKQAIIFHRHAEVVVPNELPLDSLRIVATRSSAELTTLRTLLLTRYSSQRTIWRQGLSKTNVAPEFFYCRWSFIENVQRDGDSIFVSFNADTESPGPYDVRLQWKNTKSTATSIAKLTADRSYQVRIPDGFKQGSFTLEIRLDDSLAFVGPMALIRPTLFHG